MDFVEGEHYPREYTFPPGQTVTLEAVPAPGYRFVGWSGDVAGDNPSASLVMSCAKSVTANFAPATFALTLEATPAEGGVVTAEPARQHHQYTSGETVTLRATPAPGYRFDHWEGGLSGEENPAAVTMYTDLAASAHFTGIFQWWWVAAGIGAAAVMVPAYVMVFRKSLSPGRRRT